MPTLTPVDVLQFRPCPTVTPPAHATPSPIWRHARLPPCHRHSSYSETIKQIQKFSWEKVFRGICMVSNWTYCTCNWSPFIAVDELVINNTRTDSEEARSSWLEHFNKHLAVVWYEWDHHAKHRCMVSIADGKHGNASSAVGGEFSASFQLWRTIWAWPEGF